MSRLSPEAAPEAGGPGDRGDGHGGVGGVVVGGWAATRLLQAPAGVQGGDGGGGGLGGVGRLVVPARGPSSDWLDVLLQLGRDPTALSQEDLRNRNLCIH